jgi:hypothetical protein
MRLPSTSKLVGYLLLASVVTVAGIAGACGSNDKGDTPLDPNADGGVDTSGTPIDGDQPDTSPFNLDTALDPDGGTLAIAPTDPVVDVTSGTPTPTVAFKATYGGVTIAPSWSIDRGEIGTIDVSSGVFTPGGKIGGRATVSATYAGKTATTSVTVKLHVVQNGDPTGGGGGGGAGGWGGVGGEGTGKPVDATVKLVLDGTPVADVGLKFLYPYDKTVWPRGVLSPLLQWQPGAKSYDAVYIHITETSYEYKGYFTKTATPFVHHPIPQDVWKTLAYSNGGEDVKVELAFAAGGTTIGPLTETWKIAPGTLKGTVYYNSYGTNLAHNYCCTAKGAKFGGATLAIKGTSTDPTLVAGNDTSCRVCHSVAANGSLLITQQGEDYNHSSKYDLKTLVETPMAPADGRFAYPAIYPDGSMLFSGNGGPLGAGSVPSGLFAIPAGTAITATGIPSGLGARLPAFSPDGKHVAFNFGAGTGADGNSLAVLDFDKAASAFSGLRKLYTPTAGMAIWPSFLPSNDGVVFELETVNNGRDFGGTRSTCDSSSTCSDSGTRAELWWADLKTGTAKRLDNLNGLGLPVGAAGHDKDETLNYEPTVNPIASGGYAWVVFTSRRMYGNVATINPYWSDPRFHDISVTPTTKKLWVAAIDLSAPPGTDPSHPAFYLPAQELLAGNSRGYWVVDPCHTDGTSCETGDECCGGFCHPNPGDAGGYTCSSEVPKCAAEFEKCTTDADCCGVALGIKCIGGRCTRKGPS